jgi:putative membrane protein
MEPDQSQNTTSVDKSEDADRETMVRRLVYYAAERTLMAWIRAALGLMALGFVIDRFGLILRETLPEAGTRYYPKLFSFWTGTTMVVLGTLMAVTAAVRYWRFSTAYDHAGSTHPRHGIIVGVFFALILAVFGIVITLYLIAATD